MPSCTTRTRLEWFGHYTLAITSISRAVPHRLGTFKLRANRSRAPIAKTISAWCSSLLLSQEPDTPERKYSAATLTAEWNVPSGSVISRIPPLHSGVGTSEWQVEPNLHAPMGTERIGLERGVVLVLISQLFNPTTHGTTKRMHWPIPDGEGHEDLL
jgi:hypothetical protein